MDTDRAMELIDTNSRLRHRQQKAREELQKAIDRLNSVTSFSSSDHNVTQVTLALEEVRNAKAILLEQS